MNLFMESPPNLWNVIVKNSYINSKRLIYILFSSLS
jgi:hypothetical protein